MNRRIFIEKSALSSAAFLWAAYRSSLGREEKIRIGMIGCGWYGVKLAKAVMSIDGFPDDPMVIMWTFEF